MAKIKTLIYFFYTLLRFYFLSLRVNKIFFFPFYHTGGAERVHLDIVKTTEKKSSITIFTNSSSNDHFLNEFEEHSHVFNFAPYTYHPFYRLILLFLFKFIGLFHSLTTFGCNTRFYYEVLPFMGKRVKKVDLLHAFSFPVAGLEITSLPYVQFLDRRIVINKKTKQDYIELYRKHHIPEHYLSRIDIVSNMVDIPDYEPRDDNSHRALKAMYCGRISSEKRIHLVVEIGEKLENTCEVSIIGPIEMEVKRINQFHKGSIASNEDLNEAYKANDILLITSFREGFPMVVMEAMARGVVCICTDVGGISEHIVNGSNGFLVENYDDENKIIEEFVRLITLLETDRILLKKLSKNSYEYAKENFGKKPFVDYYRKVLN